MFWASISKHGECWNWLGAQDPYGYGRFSWNGKSNAKAHRVAYAISKNEGELPHPSVLICHTCDNRICVRPEHLYAGTPQSNVQDRDSRGRYVSCEGENNGASKLTEGLVKSILSYKGKGLTQSKVAAKFGINQITVSRIWRGKTWRHITNV
jgi:hypothetical protein